MRDRAAILAEIADDFMETGKLSEDVKNVVAYPWPNMFRPTQYRFSMRCPGLTIVCCRRITEHVR